MGLNSNFFKKGLLLTEIVAILSVGGLTVKALNRTNNNYNHVQVENSLEKLSHNQLNDLYGILTDYSSDFAGLFSMNVKQGLELLLFDLPSKKLFEAFHGVSNYDLSDRANVLHAFEKIGKFVIPAKIDGETVYIAGDIVDKYKVENFASEEKEDVDVLVVELNQSIKKSFEKLHAFDFLGMFVSDRIIVYKNLVKKQMMENYGYLRALYKKPEDIGNIRNNEYIFWYKALIDYFGEIPEYYTYKREYLPVFMNNVVVHELGHYNLHIKNKIEDEVHADIFEMAYSDPYIALFHTFNTKKIYNSIRDKLKSHGLKQKLNSVDASRLSSVAVKVLDDY